MPDLIPTRFLFRFEIPLHHFHKPPATDGDLAGWDNRFLLPELHQIEGRKSFAQLWLGWHETGLYLAVRVSGKRHPVSCNAAKFWSADNIRVMTDMRDARDIRRATRFCQQFYLLPTGGGRDGKSAIGGSHKVQRARANAPVVPAGWLPVASRVTAGGYALTAHFPVDVLSGFNPTDYPRIGFYTMVEDAELGQQYLTVGDDLSWFYDPSTWATGVLTD